MNDFILHFCLSGLFYFPAACAADWFTRPNWAKKGFRLSLVFMTIIALTWEICQFEMFMKNNGWNWITFLSYYWLDSLTDIFASVLGCAIAVIVMMIFIYRTKK